MNGQSVNGYLCLFLTSSPCCNPSVEGLPAQVQDVSYSSRFGIDTLAGSNPAKVIVVNDVDNPDNNFSNPVVGSGYGFQANYRFSPGFELGGWMGYTAARAVGEVKGDADIWNYAVENQLFCAV